MPELNPWLDAHARAATVHLLPAEGRGTAMWGSGFFVAPGWVITAAHVVRPHLARDRNLTFAVRGETQVNDGIPVPARLAEWLITDARAAEVPPGEDLALVRLLDDTVEHECVWLVDRAVQHVGGIVAYGYRPGQESHPRAVPWSGDAEINVRDGAYGLRFKPDVEFPSGVSGGPLLDPDSGAVVALIKARRRERDGGLAVSIAALRRFGPLYGEVMRAHDTWHGRSSAQFGNNTWIDAQHTVVTGNRPTAGEAWTPRDRRAALSRLAALPAPPDGPTVAILARQAISGNRWPQEGPELHTWRDGHGLLYDDARPMDSMILLRYLQLVALYVRRRGGNVDALTEWIQDRLGLHTWPHMAAFVTDARLPESLEPGPEDSDRVVIPYPGPGEGPTVAVLLDPVIGPDPAHFFWQIWIDDGDGEPELFAEDRSTHGHRPGDLVQALRRPLTDVFHARDRAGRPVPLEVALPAEYFDTAVHRWRLNDIAALDDTYHLGAQRRVVLRALERRGEPDKKWAARWRAISAQRQLNGWRVPEPGVNPSPRQFGDAPHSAVPVICRSVGQGLGRTALRLALESGHGVALWRVDGHGGGACSDSCEDLHTRTKWLFEPLESITELPDRLRQLRQEISAQRTDRRWAEPLALLYDDPRRPLPAEDTTPLDAPL
ncbi:hypothetical protein GCM10018793_40120 [Streptomyces sulfonofaciens]|uniref:vWA-MoxR associated protein C-terminal domain-containing protein n=1 Tax=Streptomyces sulfonofaciens TaxID=68272 RepID=A0A919GD51_9ACTN|nr:trypsin-like peptidase domain-containing protein [Streptomyces sulfonofaciens]GHH81825.1 hypothetical protein GCM10018793_40120 [Streptomyces sulfonofaciens]